MTDPRLSSDPFSPPFQAVADAWRVSARLNVEVLALMTRRAQSYLDVPKTVTQCQTLEDAMREQVLFWQRAQLDYQACFARALAIVPAMPARANGVANSYVSRPAARTRDFLAIEPDKAAGPITPDPAVASSLPSAPAHRVRRSA